MVCGLIASRGCATMPVRHQKLWMAGLTVTTLGVALHFAGICPIIETDLDSLMDAVQRYLLLLAASQPDFWFSEGDNIRRRFHYLSSEQIRCLAYVMASGDFIFSTIRIPLSLGYQWGSLGIIRGSPAALGHGLFAYWTSLLIMAPPPRSENLASFLQCFHMGSGPLLNII